jgi:hypothetical protein
MKDRYAKYEQFYNREKDRKYRNCGIQSVLSHLQENKGCSPILKHDVSEDTLLQSHRFTEYEQLVEVLQSEIMDYKKKLTVIKSFIYVTLKTMKSLNENKLYDGKQKVLD